MCLCAAKPYRALHQLVMRGKAKVHIVHIAEMEKIMKNKTMMQYFEWYLPANGLHWRRCQAQAKALCEAGITMVWLPPAYKGAAGNQSVGYDVYDMYDLGEFEQKGAVATKYGTREEYLAAVRALQACGIEVLADVVLNHRMGADGTETVGAILQQSNDRNRDISGVQQIAAWTKFDFAARAGKYSDFCWNSSHFSGTDWDDAGKRGGIFRFEGKTWNRETDSENGNYDYLMGADLDTDSPEVIAETMRWGEWYLDTVGVDGFRLDAVKHIGFDFYRNWMEKMCAYRGREMFMVGEYWSREVARLTHYLDVTQHRLSLFDVPLHFHFYQAATSNGNYDMARMFADTLTGIDAGHAVTFVDNHDTQPGQALVSFIPAWFKPLAYAIILLRDAGIPCVFYGDYYGIPHDNVAPVAGLKTLLKIRQNYAYGAESMYFDHASVVGFTRAGDEEHENSGVVVLMTDSAAGTKKMCAGGRLAGRTMVEVLHGGSNIVTLDGAGSGEFSVAGGSVSVWVTKEAAADLYIM